MHIIRLKLRQTSQQGFLATLTYDRQHLEVEGFLPLLPEDLRSSFTKWQTAYRQLDDVRLYISPQPGFRLTPKSVQIISHFECTSLVKTYLNQWLNCNNNQWQPIRETLISLADRLHRENNTEIQFILDAQNVELHRLPWQEWDLLEKYYPNSEVAFTTPKLKHSPIKQNLPNLNSPKIRILLVVGRSNDLNTHLDFEVVRQLEERGAEVVCLMQPQLKDLCAAFWQETAYHIFIFTGHSGSREDGRIGWIEINDNESLSIEQFKDALKQAINKGLQLAIFNSCDGLGLANQLAELYLPQSIVMREPVPDEVAVEFLQYFFDEFTRDKSLFASIHTAKKRLEPFKSKYPGAIWLPALCLKSSVKPLTWQGIGRSCVDRESFSPSQINTKSKIELKKIVIACILSFVLGLGTQIMTPSIARVIFPPSNSRISSVNTLPQGTWTYSGSTTWEPIRSLVDRQIKREHPEFKLIYTRHPILPPGSGSGIKMLLDGQVSFVQSSRSLLDREYDTAAQRGLILKQVPIAIDGLAVAVNPNLKIPGITIPQLKDIYIGRITNWSQLGGADLTIVPYARPTESGTTEFFIENILGNKNFSDRVIFLEDNNLAFQQVSAKENQGAIYFASAAEVVAECTVKPLPIARRLGSAYIAPYKGELISAELCPPKRNQLNFEALQNGEYPLIRRLFAIISQNNQIDRQVGEAYTQLLLTDKGQQSIERAGFIPMLDNT